MSAKTANDNETKKHARTTKKTPTFKFAASVKSSHVLRMTEQLNKSECAVICTVTPWGFEQYTIGRPIGITDLSPNCWVLHDTDDIAGMIARQDDPDAQLIRGLRAKYVTSLQVAAAVLVEKDTLGEKSYYYPGRESETRNSILNDASKKAALKVKGYKAELNSILAKTRVKKSERKSLDASEKKRKAELTSLIQAEGQRDKCLTPADLKLEVALQKATKEGGFHRQAEAKYPTLYRTQAGPYGDKPQVAIKGSEGLPLSAVMVEFRRYCAGFQIEHDAGGQSYLEALESRGTAAGTGAKKGSI